MRSRGWYCGIGHESKGERWIEMIRVSRVSLARFLHIRATQQSGE